MNNYRLAINIKQAQDIMPSPFYAIRNAEEEDDGKELQRIFESITTEQLNEPVPIDPNSIMLQRLIHHFDLKGKYQHLIISLLNSPNVDTSRLNINHQNIVNGRTALMLAAGRGNLKVVKKLLELGANMKITTPDNRTAFAYACWFGHIEVVKLFLPQVELREYTLRSKAVYDKTVIEVVKEEVERKPDLPYLDLLNLLTKSYEEKQAEDGMGTG